MFDIGFFELLLIAVVGLLVIGPKRLPETIRTVGLWVGRLKRALGSARQEFEREFGVDEVRRQLHNENVMRQLGESRQAISDLNKPLGSSNSQSTSTNSSSEDSSSASSPSASAAGADNTTQPPAAGPYDHRPQNPASTGTGRTDKPSDKKTDA
jgi:sec-independent protein translocase protein TatB